MTTKSLPIKLLVMLENLVEGTQQQQERRKALYHFIGLGTATSYIP